MSRGVLALIISLTLVAGWLRFESTSFGLPNEDVDHLFRPDEEILVPRALRFGPDWNPHMEFPYPAAQMYLQSAALRLYAGCLGHWHDYRSVYEPHDDAEAYIVGRRLTALMGTATVPVIYFAAAPAFGVAVALISAAAVAFAPSHVRDSKFATTDVPAGFWTALGLLMLLRIVQRGTWLDYLLAGVFCGVAFATKYTALALLFGVFTAHIESRHRDLLLRSLVDSKVLLIAIGFGTAVVVCSPYLVFDWSQTVQDFRFQLAQSFPAGSNRPGWSWLLLRAMPDCFGPAFETLIIGGIIWSLVRPQRGTISLAVFIIAELLAISIDHRVFYRYLLVPLPAMAILGAVFGCKLTSLLCTALARSVSRALVYSLSILLLGLILLSFLIRDIEFNNLLLREDTRTLARAWIEANVPPGSQIAVTQSQVPYGKPQLPVPNYMLVPMEDDLADLQRKHIHWELSDSLEQLGGYSPGPSKLEQDQLSLHATLVYDVDPRLHNSTTIPIFDEGDAFYAPFGGVRAMERPGPRIRIWKLK